MKSLRGQNKKNQAKVKLCSVFFLVFSDSGGIQTHNLLIRSQMLYSVELRNPLLAPLDVRLALNAAVDFSICGCKGTHLF